MLQAVQKSKRLYPFYRNKHVMLARNDVPCISFRGPCKFFSNSSGVSAKKFESLMKKVGIYKDTLNGFYTKEGLPHQEREFPFAVALSGGADSMALTLLLKELMKNQEIQTPLLAITIDHRLRKESTAEADQVKKICVDKWNVHHITASCEWATEESLGQEDDALILRPRLSKMQEQARRYRYNLLQKVCQEQGVKCLFVAHNLGDQVETVLFRLGRASGINGLAGINSVTELVHHEKSSHSIQLIRPLLSIPKKQLKETCERFNQEWIEDPSNDSISFDRIRIRKELKRIEKEQGEEIIQLLSRCQKIAAKAKKEFEYAEKRILKKYIAQWKDGHVVLRLSFLKDSRIFDELSIRVLSEILMFVGKRDIPPRLASLQRLVKSLKADEIANGKKVTLGGCIIQRKQKKELDFRPEHEAKRS